MSFRLAALAAVVSGVLGMAAAPVSALSISAVGISQISVAATDITPPSFDSDSLNVFPVSSSVSASEGASSSTITYDISDVGLTLSFGQTLDVTPNAFAGTNGNLIRFSVDEDTGYTLSGFFEALDPVGAQIVQYLELQDETAGFVVLFSGQQVSRLEPNESFTLGLQEGNLANALSGSLTGALEAGHAYRLRVIHNQFSPAASTPTNATGSLSLVFVPEPSTPLLLALALVGLAVAAVRRASGSVIRVDTAREKKRGRRRGARGEDRGLAATHTDSERHWVACVSWRSPRMALSRLEVVALAAAALLLATPASAQVSVNFADANLETAVRTALGIPSGPILDTEMATLVDFDASGAGISDLTGIEFATNLTGLFLGSNQISDVTPLAGLASLTDLGLWDNQIADVTPLAGLASLVVLGLDGNQVADLTPLSGLTGLDELQLIGNQVIDLGPLSGLTSLTRLFLGSNQISDVTPLAGLTSLAAVGLWDNQIAEIAGLVSNPGLGAGDQVQLWDNPLACMAINTDIPSLQALGVIVGANAIPPACCDGIDNDFDEETDFPADPGCRDPDWQTEDPRCQDGVNNDRDGLIDFDGGTSLDLDGDGFVDALFNPATPPLTAPDPHCIGRPYRNGEGAACGLGFELVPLLLVLAASRRRSPVRN